MNVTVVQAQKARLRVLGAVFTLELGEHRRETLFLQEQMEPELQLAQLLRVRCPLAYIGGRIAGHVVHEAPLLRQRRLQ